MAAAFFDISFLSSQIGCDVGGNLVTMELDGLWAI
jgi:hypothetical protein